MSIKIFCSPTLHECNWYQSWSCHILNLFRQFSRRRGRKEKNSILIIILILISMSGNQNYNNLLHPTHWERPKSLFHFIVLVCRSVKLGSQVIKNNKNLNIHFDLLNISSSAHHVLRGAVLVFPFAQVQLWEFVERC